MIEVNLLPGGQKKSGRGKGLSLALPKFGGGLSLPQSDPWIWGAAAAVLISIVGVSWLAFSVLGEAEELDVQIEAAVRDSTRYADVIERSAMLQARRDSIAQRVGIIQEIDNTRYVWPRLMDEVARALPEYTWLTGFQQVSSGENLLFRIEARAGTYFALTAFMEALETSPFIREVRLIESAQTAVAVGDGVTRQVYEFVLEASRSEPPEELIETVPLFGSAVVPIEEGG